MKRAAAILLIFLFLSSSAWAWSGRRAVAYAKIQIMLAKNEPYAWGTADCSMQMWRILCESFPELKKKPWFRRTTAEIMANWPWQALMCLDEAEPFDLLFAGKRPRTTKVTHTMMVWIKPGTIVHSTKSRGFAATNLWPYWGPRTIVGIRPPWDGIQ